MSQTQPVVVQPGTRALGLDAVRGLAILLMCLSGLVPRWLPNAMYHGNYPQYMPADIAELPAGPDASAAQRDASASAFSWDGWEKVENPWRFVGGWVGITWVDVVFPMFLFALGAAVPLAMAARQRKGATRWTLLRATLWRFVVLVLFAVYARQVTPTFIASPTGDASFWLALLGFLLLFPALMRLPGGGSQTLRRGTGSASAPVGPLMIRAFGVVGCVALVAAINGQEGRGFKWSDHDIIILLLAWMALLSALLYLAAPGRPWLRFAIGVFVGVVAHQAALPDALRWWGPSTNGSLLGVLDAPRGWLDWRGLNDVLPGELPEGLLHLSPLYSFGWFKFLCVVIPGMLVGDWLARPASAGHGEAAAWSAKRWWLLAGLLGIGGVFTLLTLGDAVSVWLTLFGYEVRGPFAAALLGMPWLVAAALLAARPAGEPTADTVRRIAWWGVLWTLAGTALAVAPGWGGAWLFEGGIRKGSPSTLSWYAASVGLTAVTLAVAMIIIDVRGHRRPMGLLIANGQNPMLAYIGIRSLLWPLTALPLIGWLAGDAASIESFAMRSVATLAGPDASPWWDVGWDVLKTLALALVVWWFTRRRVVWRS